MDQNFLGRDHHPQVLQHLDGRRRNQSRIYSRNHGRNLGWSVVKDRVHVHDLQATILHCLGLEHTCKLIPTNSKGAIFASTDVAGSEVVNEILA